MKDIYNIDREDLINFIEDKFRSNRNIPLPLTDLTIEFFGKPNLNDYRELWLFFRAKLIIVHVIRSLRKKYALHIFSINKGYIIVENKEDFDIMIRRYAGLKRRITDLIQRLTKNKDSKQYKKRVDRFYSKRIVVSSDEFNRIAKERLKK